MIKSEMFEIVRDLGFDNKITVFKSGDTEIQLLRPSVLSARFKDYDVKKNFQVWLKQDKREFRPNHLRVMIDLNLRIRSRPELKKKLLLAFDNIFYGKDPEVELKDLGNEQFKSFYSKLTKEEIKLVQKEGIGDFLNPLVVTGVLAQLFIIEQEYGYHKESMFEPLTLFFQGWIREFIDNPKEIDNLCMSVCNGQPPIVKYTYMENKKHKKFDKNFKPLWYLDN